MMLLAPAIDQTPLGDRPSKSLVGWVLEKVGVCRGGRGAGETEKGKREPGRGMGFGDRARAIGM